MAALAQRRTSEAVRAVGFREALTSPPGSKLPALDLPLPAPWEQEPREAGRELNSGV